MTLCKDFPQRDFLHHIMCDALENVNGQNFDVGCNNSIVLTALFVSLIMNRPEHYRYLWARTCGLSLP